GLPVAGRHACYRFAQSPTRRGSSRRGCMFLYGVHTFPAFMPTTETRATEVGQSGLLDRGGGHSPSRCAFRRSGFCLSVAPWQRGLAVVLDFVEPFFPFRNGIDFETFHGRECWSRSGAFRYLDDAKRGLTSAREEVGFIAQEVREVIPDAVTEDKDG